MGDKPAGEFEQAGDQAGGNLLSEFWHLLMQTKKWWMLPILIILLLFGGLLLVSGTALAPFIYTLF